MYLANVSDQEALDVLQAHSPRGRRRLVTRQPQADVPEPDELALSHEDGPLHRMIELADVARPGKAQQGLESIVRKPIQSFSVVACVCRRKMAARIGMSSFRSLSAVFGSQWC